MCSGKAASERYLSSCLYSQNYVLLIRLFHPRNMCSTELLSTILHILLQCIYQATSISTHRLVFTTISVPPLPFKLHFLPLTSSSLPSMMELHRNRLPRRLISRPGVSGFLNSTELTRVTGTASRTNYIQIPRQQEKQGEAASRSGEGNAVGRESRS